MCHYQQCFLFNFSVPFAFFVNNLQIFADAVKGSGEKKRYHIAQNLNFNTGSLTNKPKCLSLSHMRRRATERMKESLHARLDVQVKGKTWHNIRVNYKAFLVKYKPEDTSSV